MPFADPYGYNHFVKHVCHQMPKRVRRLIYMKDYCTFYG